MNAIFTRRSVRQFKDTEIKQDQIEMILKAGMQAPSAWGQKSWEFIVVSGRENLDALSKCHAYTGCIKGATLSIIVLGNTEKMNEPTMWEQDLGACTQNILLQATEMGLGSVWCGVAPNKANMDFVTDLYDLPKNLKPYCILGLGYPMQENAIKFVDRYDETVVRYVK